MLKFAAILAQQSAEGSTRKALIPYYIYRGKHGENANRKKKYTKKQFFFKKLLVLQKKCLSLQRILIHLLFNYKKKGLKNEEKLVYCCPRIRSYGR